MTISDEIRMLCARLNISMAELARLSGQSPQNFSSKLKRKSFTVADLEKIADAAGVKFERSFVLDNGERI
jgi:transcriptional regulator with XRE-family HTH domain